MYGLPLYGVEIKEGTQTTTQDTLYGDVYADDGVDFNFAEDIDKKHTTTQTVTLTPVD